MRKVNELIAHGKHPGVARLLERIERNPMVGDWSRNFEAEERLNSNLEGLPPAGLPHTYCYELVSGPLRPVSLILHGVAWDELEVASIVTKDRKPLEYLEYNRLLGDFYSNVLIPLSLGIDLDLRIRPGRVRIEESLSPEAMLLLTKFAADSTKGTSKVPDGFNWDRFVVRAYVDRTLFDPEDLNYWLMSEGFSSEDCRDLMNSFESGQSLLSAYDQARAG